MTLCNENYKQCSCSHLKNRIAELESYNATRTDELAAAARRIATLEQQVAALKLMLAPQGLERERLAIVKATLEKVKQP